MDWALSVTGPYESTAIVTGPMPRKPKATRPNAKVAGAGGLGGREALQGLGNEGPRGRPARDAGAELPPEGPVAELGDQEVRHDERDRDRDERRDPDEGRQRRLEVHLVG